MQKDFLNSYVFISKNGKDYRTPLSVDHEEVRGHFQKLGFELLGIHQIFRHTHGMIRKNGETFFFKMGSTKDISERTHNEMIWNMRIGERLREETRISFETPRIYSHGTLNDKFYFICDFFGGAFLATKSPPNTEHLQDWLDQIVQFLRFLQSLKDISFPRDMNEFSGKKAFGTIFWEQDKLLLADLVDFSLGKLLDMEKSLNDLYYPSVTHGDFVPWHMIQNNGRIVLIDGEHGSSILPAFYDAAYFYHRVYTVAQDPECAKSFMLKFICTLNKEEKMVFEKTFKSLLANRIISGFWNAKNDRKNDFTFHFAIKQDFLSDNLY